MSIDNSKKSPRLLQSRRYTHETFTDAQEAFTSVLDINSDEVYIDQNLIPSSSVPLGTSGDNLSVYSSGGQQVMKYYYRYKMTKSSTNSEVWFFTTGTTAGIDAQLIESNQQKNFISPKYSIPSLSTANAEDATPGYGVKVFVSTNSSSPSAGDQISSTKFVFDYKTGVLQFVLTADAPTVSQYVYISAYQYVGRALSTGLTTLTSNNTSLSSSVATTTSALSSSIGSLSSSVASINNTQNGRLDSLETASGSIRSDFNTFTSSYNTGSFTGSFKGDGSQLYNIPSSGITGLSLFQIASGSATASISPNNGLVVNTNTTITGSLNVSGIITAKEIHSSIVTSSVLYESGSTKFGDTADDTHSFTGSVLIDGLLNVNRIAPLSGSNVRVESSNLVVPNGGIFTSFNIQATGSVSASTFSGSAVGLINVPFQISGSDLSGNTYNKQFTKLQFDDSTGLNVEEIVSGTAFISIGSHFKDIFVSGSPILSATGSDAFEVIGAGGLGISTSITDTNGNGYVKELTISATSLSSSLNSRMDTITGSITTLSSSLNSRINTLNTFTSSVVLTSQTGSMTVLSASYAATASFALNAGGGGGSSIGVYSSLVVTSAASTWSFQHDTSQRYPIFQVFDNNGYVVIPSQIQTIDDNNANIIFPSPQTGRVIASLGGGNGTTQEFTSSSLWTVDHYLGTDYPDVTVWDSNRNVVFPNRIESVNTNQIKIYFSQAISGNVSVSRGGHIITGSLSWVNLLNKPSGLVSGSSQLTGSYDTRYVLSGSITQTTWDNIANKPSGLISGSVQVDLTSTTGYSTFSSSISTSIGSLSSSVATTTSGLSSSIGSLSSSVATTTSGLSSSIGSLSSSVATTTNGLTSTITSLSSSLTSSIGSLSSSIETTTSGLSSSIGSLSSSIATTDSNQNTRLNNIETSTGSLNSFTSSINTTIKSKLDSDGVISGSSQIIITGTTGYSTFSSSISTSIGSLSSSVATTTSGLSSSIGSLSSSIASINNTQNGRLDSIESSTASLNTYTSSNTTIINAIHTSTSSLNSFSSSILGAIEITGSNLTVKGNLLVKGTTTQIDSTTLNIGDNIIELNGTGTSNGGLVVRDGTGANIISGSLLWDTTLDYWKAGPLGSEERIILVNEYNTFSTSINSRANSIESTTSSLNSFTSSINTTIKSKLNSEGVVSGSLQIDITSTTGYSTFSSSISNSIGSLSSSVATTTSGLSSSIGSLSSSISTSIGSLSSSVASIDNTQNGRLDSLETASGSIRTNFNSFTSSYNTGSFTGSFKGDGGLLYNIPASGVTGLNLTQIADGSVTASVSNANGLRINSKTEITGSLIVTNGITGSIDYSNITNKPTLVSGSSQISYTGITNIPSGIVSGSEQLTGSYDTRYVLSGSITQTTWNNIASKPNDIVSSSNQISAFGFLQTSSFNTYTSSNDSRVSSLESFTASLNTNYVSETEFGTYTGSINTFTSSVNSYTSSNNGRVSSLESKTGSYATTGSNSFIGTENITGSLIVSNSLNVIGTQNVTGSLIVSNSLKVIGTQNINGNLSVTGSLVISGSLDLSNANIDNSRYLHTQGAASTTWTIVHNLNYLYPNITVYDASNKVMLPAEITSIDVNTTQLTFAVVESGHALASVGGISTSAADRFLYTQASATGSWVIDHNIGYKYVTVNVYDGNDEQLVPLKITAVSINRTQIDFSLPTTGNAIITVGGARSTSMFNLTGSYYNTTSNIGITGSLVVTGDVDGNSFNTTSDKKLKTNLVRIENALDKIEKLNGYTFDWLEEYSEDRSRQIGMVADEVYEVQPELISHRDIVLSNKEEKIKLLDYSKVTALLLEAIKELNDKVTKLENKKKKK